MAKHLSHRERTAILLNGKPLDVPAPRPVRLRGERVEMRPTATGWKQVGGRVVR